MTANKPGTSFWIIAIVGLIWNLMGVYNFFLTVTNSASFRAQYTLEQLQVLDAGPSWMHVVFGIGVITGTLGCLFLILKKKLAIATFAVSLVAVLIQMGFSTFATDSVKVFGIGMGIVMPIIIIAIAIFLYYYSKGATQKGWIN
ncbi:hypothetical protein [Ulvibacter litoralis]|uniref:Sugar transporter n=1 Tax=Ulvibacter litoralis TaxID=227084 RepID=A0A1G7FCT1_9FLAO|nr:hypothetical protein [Ulvibacter litoralis]GHC51709.1 hypothetical protein GCM10008083_14260 [Ulvibacter litoralis]SDE73692.1 hypothetical protein SAMN05421855_102478 [Ulvibacter litoralis]